MLPPVGHVSGYTSASRATGLSSAGPAHLPRDYGVLCQLGLSSLGTAPGLAFSRKHLEVSSLSSLSPTGSTASTYPCPTHACLVTHLLVTGALAAVSGPSQASPLIPKAQSLCPLNHQLVMKGSRTGWHCGPSARM